MIVKSHLGEKRMNKGKYLNLVEETNRKEITESSLNLLVLDAIKQLKVDNQTKGILELIASKPNAIGELQKFIKNTRKGNDSEAIRSLVQIIALVCLSLSNK